MVTGGDIFFTLICVKNCIDVCLKKTETTRMVHFLFNKTIAICGIRPNRIVT